MKLPITLHIYKRENRLYKVLGSEDEFEYHAVSADFGDSCIWGIRVATVTTTLAFDDLSPAEFVQAQVNDLKAQAKQIQADAQAKVTAIEGQINSLLAIDMKGTP